MEGEAAEKITERALAGQPSLVVGCEALKFLLTVVVPEPDAWGIEHPEDDGPFATVYVLAGRAVYRLRASVERSPDGDSSAGCDLFTITDTARFYSSLAITSGPGEPQTAVHDWSFDFDARDSSEDTSEIRFRANQPLTGRDDPGKLASFAVELADRFAGVSRS